MKKTKNLNPSSQLNNEKPGKIFFYTFRNITKCLKTKVSVRIEWLGNFVYDSVIEGEKVMVGGLKWMN